MYSAIWKHSSQNVTLSRNQSTKEVLRAFENAICNDPSASNPGRGGVCFFCCDDGLESSPNSDTLYDAGACENAICNDPSASSPGKGGCCFLCCDDGLESLPNRYSSRLSANLITALKLNRVVKTTTSYLLSVLGTSHEAECRPFLIPVPAPRKAQPRKQEQQVNNVPPTASAIEDQASIYSSKQKNTGGGPGSGPHLIVDDGGDATLLIHEGVKAEEEFAKTEKVSYPSSTDNAEFQILLNIMKEGLSVDPLKDHKMKERLVGVSEETTIGVKRLYQMQANGTLLFPAINVNDYHPAEEPVLLGRGDLINDNAPKKPMDRATAGGLYHLLNF
ncbi:S-adenosyl-L-homocysteine hydrolase [Tanacetum coccineum]